MTQDYSIPDFHERLLALKEELNKRGLPADEVLRKAAENMDIPIPERTSEYKITPEIIKQIVEEELDYMDGS